MLKHRLFSVLVSTLAFVVLAGVIAQGLAVFESKILDVHDATLRLGRDSVEATIRDAALESEALVYQFAENVDLAEDFSQFGQVVQKGQGAWNKGKLDEARSRVDDHILNFRNEYNTVSGISLMNRHGMIQVAQSDFFSITQKVNLEELDFVANALKGETGFALVSAERMLRFVGAAPLWDEDSDDPVGVALVEHVVTHLPVLPEGMTIAVVGTAKTQIGTIPPGVKLPAGSASRLPVRIGAGNVDSILVGPLNRIPIEPLFVNRDAIGVMAVSFGLPGQTGLTGWVFSDSSLIFAQLGGAQLTLIALALLIWLLHLVLTIFGGSDLSSRVDEVSDFASRTLQGAAVTQRLDPDTMPQELQRLAALVVRLADRPTSEVSESSADRAPDFASVLTSGDNSDAPDFASLELEGLLDNRTIPLDNLAFAPMEVQGQSARAPAPLAKVTGAMQAAVPASATLPDGSITRPFNETEEANTLPPKPQGAGVEIPNSGPVFDGAASSPAYDTISGFLAQVPEVPSAGSSADPFVADPDDWSDVTLEPLPDFEPEEEPTIVDTPDEPIQPAITHLGGSDSGATSVMRVSPELMAQMRSRDPEVRDGPVDQTMQMPVLPSGLPATPAGIPATAPTSAVATESSPSSELVVQSLDAIITGSKTNPQLVPPPSLGTAQVQGLSPEERVKAVFEAFVSMREKCGEQGDISFNKFRARLEKSSKMVLEKHKCKDVSFRVYEKNGRAALKATPIH